MRQALRCLRLSGVSFMATVAFCVSLQPGDVLTHDGLSFYGNFHQTVLPYGVGLCLTAALLLRASQLLVGTPLVRPLRQLLAVMSLALFGVVLTPSLAPSRFVQGLHVLFAALIFTAQLFASRQLLGLRTGRFDRGLVALQLLAVVVALLSFGWVGELSLMLPAQTVAIGAFGVLLLRAMRDLAAPPAVLSVAVSRGGLPAEKL